MKNSFGTNVIITLFGESHGPCIGAVLDGMQSGIKIDTDYIRTELKKRAGSPDISTSRREDDDFSIVSGVKDGFTTGTPICIVINNADTRPEDYDALSSVPRPGHADYTAECKYNGFQDKRGGGHFSGRITAALVAAGAICKKALEDKGIYIGTHISECAGISDIKFDDIRVDIVTLSSKDFPVLCDNKASEMKAEILKAKEEKDSVGGILETAVIGIEAGIGEPWFDTVEGMLSHALFSIPAIKGVEFGSGFASAGIRGSENNDALTFADGEITHITNNAGGINGGITNGMPIVFRCAVKPTPSIGKIQQTVNTDTRENTEILVSGRHDPAIIHRAAPVVNAVTALVLCDFIASEHGRDYFN